MKSAAVTIEDKVDELVDCLDKDCQHILETLSEINELRALVIKRDDAALSKMLESIQTKSEDYRKNESKRQLIREELANALGYSMEQVTLSSLETSLHGTTRIKIAERNTRLKSLIEELRREHFSTALLLKECARFNNLLLESIFNLGKKEVVCYDSRGATRRQSDTAFINFQL